MTGVCSKANQCAGREPEMDNTGCNFLNNSWVVFGQIHCRLFQEEMLDIRIKNTLLILKEIVGYSRQHAGWCVCSNKGKGYLNHMNCSGRIYKREVITNFSGCTTVGDVHDSWIHPYLPSWFSPSVHPLPGRCHFDLLPLINVRTSGVLSFKGSLNSPLPEFLQKKSLIFWRQYPKSSPIAYLALF